MGDLRQSGHGPTHPAASFPIHGYAKNISSPSRLGDRSLSALPMSLNSILLQIVLISCGALLLQGKRIATGLWAIAATNLLILGISYALQPSRAGWISGAIWGVTLLWPALILIRLNRLTQREQYAQAASLAQRWQLLQFIGGYLQCPDFLQGLDLAQRGQVQEALTLLSRYRQRSGAIGQNANLLYYRLTARWTEFLNWVELNFAEAELVKSPSALAITYVRAQGEVGNLNRLLQTFEQISCSSNISRDHNSFNLLRMMVLAFCGRRRPVQHIFDNALSSASSATQRFWLATTTLAAGDRKAGQVQLKALRQEASAVFEGAIAYRLAHCTPIAQTQLSPTSLAILNQLETTVLGEVSLGDAGRSRPGQRPLATYSLIGLNVAIFLSQSAAIFLTVALDSVQQLSQIPGLGLTSRWAYNYALGILTLGPLVPEAVLAGQWWRLISAAFLHAGWVHIIANMVGLYYYGSFVEAKLGRAQFLLIYAITGIGSMAGMMGVALLQGELNLIGLGASGAVMGLLGTLLVMLLRSWQRSKSPLTAQHFRLLLVLVLLQTAMDFWIPQVSQSAHLTGLALGIGLGQLLLHRPGLRTQP